MKGATVSAKYAFGKTVAAMGFDQPMERVTQELAREGFGVRTEIAVAVTLKKSRFLCKSAPMTF